MIESVPAAVSRVKVIVTKAARARAVQEHLKGTANPRSMEGKALLQRRAEFITELRKQGIWP